MIKDEKPQSKNAQRLKKYRAKMGAAGFRRLSFYVSPDLGQLLDKERQPSECRGRTLERLLLGKAAKRPDYWTPAELASKRAKRKATQGKIMQS